MNYSLAIPTLLASYHADRVERRHTRIYRNIAQAVIRWYSELDEGIIQSDRGPVFDIRILNFKIDVDAVMATFNEREVLAVLLVHRDGLTHAQAAVVAGLPSDRPDLLVESIEARLGQALHRKHLGEFLSYVEYFR